MKIWAFAVLSIAGATALTVIATSDDRPPEVRTVDAPSSTQFPDLAPPDPEVAPATSSPAPRPAAVRRSSSAPDDAETDAGGDDGRPGGSIANVTEGEFADSSEGDDELEAELEEEEEEAEREAEEDEQKAKQRADEERNDDD